jgi:hypothetical protein
VVVVRMEDRALDVIDHFHAARLAGGPVTGIRRTDLIVLQFQPSPSLLPPWPHNKLILRLSQLGFIDRRNTPLTPMQMNIVPLLDIGRACFARMDSRVLC